MLFIEEMFSFIKTLLKLAVLSVYWISVIVSPVTIILSLCGVDISVWITITSTLIALLTTSWFLREQM